MQIKYPILVVKQFKIEEANQGLFRLLFCLNCQIINSRLNILKLSCDKHWSNFSAKKVYDLTFSNLFLAGQKRNETKRKAFLFRSTGNSNLGEQ
jgi:hypothetical protein